MQILGTLTSVPAHERTNTLSLEDPEIFKYPVLYIIEVSWWQMTDAEAKNLRAFLDKGSLQKPLTIMPPGSSEAIVDPRQIRAVRRTLRRGEAGLVPGRHHALALEASLQATSPLRRFQDLAAHRQIAAALRGDRLPYDAPAMQRVAASTERAEADARRAERSRDRYWMLRWFGQRVGVALPGLVVETWPRPVVLLDETCTEEVVPGLAAGVGERVEVRVIRANPRADLLVLR